MHRLWDNPIFLRSRQVETRLLGSGPRGIFTRFGAMLLIALGPLFTALLFNSGSLLHNPACWASDVLPCIMAFSGTLCVLYVTMRSLNATFSAISLEREQQTYDSLLSTRLTSAELVEGKLAAGLWPVLRELALAVPVSLGLGLLTGCLGKVVAFLTLCLACVFLFGLLGLWASYTSPTSARANRKAGGLMMFFLVGGPVLDWLAYVLLAPRSMGSDFVPVCTLLSPLAAWGSLAAGHGLWVATILAYVACAGLLVVRLKRLAQAARGG